MIDLVVAVQCVEIARSGEKGGVTSLPLGVREAVRAQNGQLSVRV
jgi:hypothetical protein